MRSVPAERIVSAPVTVSELPAGVADGAGWLALADATGSREATCGGVTAATSDVPPLSVSGGTLPMTTMPPTTANTTRSVPISKGRVRDFRADVEPAGVLGVGREG